MSLHGKLYNHGSTKTRLTCQRCGQSNETILQTFRQCPTISLWVYATFCWKNCRIGHGSNTIDLRCTGANTAKSNNNNSNACLHLPEHELPLSIMKPVSFTRVLWTEAVAAVKRGPNVKWLFSLFSAVRKIIFFSSLQEYLKTFGLNEIHNNAVCMRDFIIRRSI